MKDSQLEEFDLHAPIKYIKANNERFSTLYGYCLGRV